jgi:dUTP pyrophosphatase
MILKYYKLHDDVITPKQATKGSVCFDIFFYIKDGVIINSHFPKYDIIKRNHYSDIEQFQIKDGVCTLPSWKTHLIPTGLVFDIPVGYHLKLYERSSTCLKTNYQLANKIGIIDSDYKEELFIPIKSKDKSCIIICNDNVARFQIELCKSTNVVLQSIKRKPKRITNRKGGFGSTNTK